MKILFSFLLFSSLANAQPPNPDKLLKSVNQKACAAQQDSNSPLVLCSQDTLTKLQTACQTKQTSTIVGLDPLINYANALSNPVNAAKYPNLSVTQSSFTPPSGDKHDYASIMIYGWPTDPNDLKKPWVYKDGQINTARTQIAPDSDYLGKTSTNIQVTATAYAVTGDQKYAKKSADLIRSWFIDPNTKMNPNLNYAQSLPSVNTGSNYGIIEGNSLIQVLDSEKMLESSGQLSVTDQAVFKKWMSDYANWLETSVPGIKESQMTNNHLSWYYLQLASIYTFLGKTDQVKQVITKAQNIVATQINPDGSMPQEIKRTRPLHYNLYNLNALTDLAILGKNVGVDLFNYQTTDGRSIKKAVQYIAPCIQNGGTCPFKAEAIRTTQAHQSDANGVELCEPQNALQVLERASSLDAAHPYQNLISPLSNTVMTWNMDPQIVCEPRP